MGVREIAEKWFTAVEMTTSHLRDPSDWPSHTLEIFWRLNPLHKSSQINSNGIQDIYPPFLEKWWFSESCCDFTKRIARECTWILAMEKSGLFNDDFALDSVLAKVQISELIIFFKEEDCLWLRLLTNVFIIWIHKVYTQYLVCSLVKFLLLFSEIPEPKYYSEFIQTLLVKLGSIGLK